MRSCMTSIHQTTTRASGPIASTLRLHRYIVKPLHRRSLNHVVMWRPRNSGEHRLRACSCRQPAGNIFHGTNSMAMLLPVSASCRDPQAGSPRCPDRRNSQAGRGGGVGRTLGVMPDLGVGVGLTVAVGVAVTVALGVVVDAAVAVAVGVNI